MEVELHFSDLESKMQNSVYNLNDKEDNIKEIGEFKVSVNDNKLLESFSPKLQHGGLNAILKNYVVRLKMKKV